MTDKSMCPGCGAPAGTLHEGGCPEAGHRQRRHRQRRGQGGLIGPFRSQQEALIQRGEVVPMNLDLVDRAIRLGELAIQADTPELKRALTDALRLLSSPAMCVKGDA